MDTSNECSTDFEFSTSVAPAASVASEDQYDDDDFVDYSDSFESDNEASTTAASNSTELDLWSVGTRVQVFWSEENEWFDGEIKRVEVRSEPRYFVHYDDGEQHWEDPSNIRPHPATRAQYDQLQQLLPLNAEMVGRGAMVALNDGDSRWEQTTMDHPKDIAPNITPDITSALLSPPERVLYARPYKQVVNDHFQPVRIARPYRCTIEKHSESVIFPRRSYHAFLVEKADRITQTSLPSCFTET